MLFKIVRYLQQWMNVRKKAPWYGPMVVTPMYSVHYTAVGQR